MSASKPEYALVLNSPLGHLGVCLRGEIVCGIDFLGDAAGVSYGKTQAEQHVSAEISQYFGDSERLFNLHVDLAGTAFQLRVWDALLLIPPGETRTYGQLAAQLDSGARAVGNACRNNPLPIVVPCHRVVAASGLGGYAGKTDGPVLQRKQWLLAHEGIREQDLKTPLPTPTRELAPNHRRNLHA